MKILVVGATGVVGRLLVPLLVEAKHHVIGTTRSTARAGALTEAGAQAAVMDAMDREGVFAVMLEHRPEVLITQQTDLRGLDFAANSRLRVEGTRNLIDAARESGVHKVIAQSVAWAYAPGDGPAKEDDPLDVDAADESRRRFVSAVKTLEDITAEISEWVVLRYGLLYGPDTFYDRGGMTAVAIRDGKRAANEGVSSFVHIEDAARAAAALDWPRGVVNIADNEPARGSEWMPAFADLIGGPTPKIEGAGEAWERGASNQKARESLGWELMYPSWREGFGKALG